MPAFRRVRSDNPFRDMESTSARAIRLTGMYYGDARRQAPNGRISRNLRIARGSTGLDTVVVSNRLRGNLKRLTRGRMPTSLRREVAGQISMFDFTRQPAGGSSSHS